VTLNDFERCNGRVVCVISPNSVAFRAHYVKVVEDTPIHSPSEMYPEESSFQWHITLAIFVGITPSEGVKVRHSPVASENLTYNQP